MILTARGVEQHADGTDTAQAWINLALALGLPGRGPGNGWGTITGQGNGQGGREHGQKADQLPGYRRSRTRRTARTSRRSGASTRTSCPARESRAYELLDRLGTDADVRALLVSASNPVVSAPNARHVEERFAALDFLAVTDIFLSETAQLADVVLPTTQWAEESGTMTNPEGRVLLRRKAVDPPPGVRSDLQIWREIADRLGSGAASSRPSPRRSSPSCGGRVRAGSPTTPGSPTNAWPQARSCSGRAPPRTTPAPRACSSTASPRRTGAPTSSPVRPRLAAELPDEAHPYLLTTGRARSQYQSGTQTRRSPTLAAAVPRPYVELHPELARSLGIADGDAVRLSTPRGQRGARRPARSRHPAATPCSCRSTGAARPASTR